MEECFHTYHHKEMRESRAEEKVYLDSDCNGGLSLSHRRSAAGWTFQKVEDLGFYPIGQLTSLLQLMDVDRRPKMPGPEKKDSGIHREQQ